jgi:hypothetical protein
VFFKRAQGREEGEALRWRPYHEPFAQVVLDVLARLCCHRLVEQQHKLGSARLQLSRHDLTNTQIQRIRKGWAQSEVGKGELSHNHLITSTRSKVRTGWP